MAAEEKILIDIEVKAGNIAATQKAIDELKKANTELSKSYDANSTVIEANKAKIKNLQQEQRIEQKELQSLTKEVKGNSGAYDKLSMEYTVAAKKAKDLGVIYGENSKQFKAASKEADNLGNRLKVIDAAVGQNQRKVGSYFQSIVKGGLAAAGAFVGFQAISGFVSSVVDQVKEFSKAASELSALTGATGDDLDKLKERAKELAKDFGKSASEIVTAMKLVGSAKPELLKNVDALGDMTQAVLVLSKATGMELSDTTNSLTTIMNQFGLSALDADRAINVLAAGSKFGAREVDYLGEAISKVGTVADSAGLNIETTTAAMELFGEKGVRAEVAGNGFKRVLVELQSDTKNYTNGVFDLNKAIDNNKNIAGDNIALQEKFGKEYFNIAQILLKNKDRFYELTEQVTGTTTAQEQMAIATDNLSGDISKMSASWGAFILSLEDGDGVIAKTFRGFIQWAKDAIDVITDLQKTNAQKQADIIKTNSDARIKDFKTFLTNQKDKIKYIEDEIKVERSLYEPRKARAKEIELEIQKNNQLGGAWKENNKELEKERAGLIKSVTGSIAYVNALAGLKSAYEAETTATETSTATTEENTKEKDKAAKAAAKLAKEREKAEKDSILAIIKEWEEENKAKQSLLKDAYAMIGALDDERISKLKSDSKLALEEIEKDTALSEDQKFLYTAQVQRNLQKEIEKIQQEAARRKIDLATGNIEDALRVELLKVADNERAKLELEIAAEKEALDKILELKGANQKEQDAIDEAALVKKNSIKQKEIALDSLTYATQLNLALDDEEKIYQIKLAYLNKEIEANKNNKDKLAELEKQKTELVKAENQKKVDAAFQMADQIGGALSALNQLQSAIQAGEEQKLDEKATADKERIDKLESDGVLTKEQADKKRADSDKALDKEKKKLALEAAKREKNMSYFSALLSTASGVANALTVKPAFLIPAFLSLAAITGALQIATIAKTPLPKAARGKYIRGNSHANGGVNINAEHGEVIINKHSTRKYLPLLSAINEECGGVSFMPKAANGMYVNDGGFSARSEGSGVDLVSAMSAAMSQINIFTAVTDINREQGKQSKVVQSGII